MSLDSMGPSTISGMALGSGGGGGGSMGLSGGGGLNSGGYGLGPASNNNGPRMIHSLSTPSGVDGSTTPHNRGGKKLAIRVQMLDDSVTFFQVQAKAYGKVLFEQVCRQLSLLEADYFGLEYEELQTSTKYWLDLEKPINRQVGLSLIEPVLKFCVKFYTPDPSQLEEEYTRYLFCLQVKRDLANGTLQCSDNSAALMASYIVQASCGDYASEDYPDHTYLSSYRFIPQQDHTIQRKIMDNHKKHIGQSPAEADLNLLETARRCELYGMKMHAGKDHEGVPLNLAVAHMGISVFQGVTRINTFSWAKIRKISFKRKKFLIKLHPEGHGCYKDTVEFFFDGRNECKNFWKKCVENHGFFRCSTVQNMPRRKARVLSRGSSFRYSGKTQKQIIEFVRDNYVKRQTFQRSQSFRQGPLHSGNRSRSQTSCNVNSSISAHPLLPIESAEWEYRNQGTGSRTPSQTKKPVDMGDRPRDTHTDHNHSLGTPVRVETYPMKSYAHQESQQLQQQSQMLDPQDSSRSVSPGGTWNFPNHINNNVREADRARVRQDGLNSGPNNLHYAILSPKYIHHNNKYMYQPQLEHSSSMAETASSTSRESVILPVDNQIIQSATTAETSTAATASTISPTATATHTTIGQVHYNNTGTYSMSKSVSTATDLSDDIIDNIIYSDINDLYGNSNNNKKTTAVTTQTNNFDCNDIYATIDRKNKTSHKQAQLQQQLLQEQQQLQQQHASKNIKNNQNHFSDEFIDNSIRNYTCNSINSNSINNINNTNNNIDSTDYYKDKINNHSDTSDYFSQNKSYNIMQNLNNTNNNTSSTSTTTINTITNSQNINNSNNNSKPNNYYLPQIQPRSTYSLPRNSELAAIDSLDLYDIQQSHYQTSHHSLGYIPNNNSNTNNKNINYIHYSNIKPHDASDSNLNNPKAKHIEGESNFNSPHHHKLSSERLEYELSNSNIYSAIQYKNYDDYNYNNIKDSWQRSASCKELYDLTYEDIKRRTDSFLFEREFLTSDRIDSPITRYDESRHSMYVPKNYSIDNSQEFQNLPETKIYSSSYPGTTCNTIDHQMYRRNQYHNNYDFNGSQDDISHDSYELLEKSDDDIYYRIKQIHSDPHTRSCSIDSGHYVPTDDDSPSETGYLKYRTPLDVKCKSAADIMNDIFFMDDPRDLPREKLCVKSDGSFYKHIKKSMGSRTSSQDSKSDFFESKISKSSDSSKKSKDSVYHTDSKKSRETSKSKCGSGYNSRASSQESKESFGIGDMLTKNYEMPKTTGKKPKGLKTNFDSISRNSSQESKSDYYDAQLSMERSFEADDFDTLDKDEHPKVKSHESLMAEIKMQCQQNSFYETQTYSSTFPTQKNASSKATTKVHSISLQNVETERHLKTCSSYKSPEICAVPKPIETHAPKATHIWPEEIEGLSTVVADIPKVDKARAFRKKSDSENIFSFDKDKIESLTGSSPNSEAPVSIDVCRKSPDYPLTPELLSEFDKQNIESPHLKSKKTSRKEELMAKTHFEEYNPKLMIDANIQLPEVFTYTHATVERTKSDPNSLANRPRLGPNSRRHTLMHQKSIDLTPADSSEEEYLYKQIPSAPPLCRTHGSHFELPKCYEAATMPKEIPQNGFELPKSFFKEYEKRLNKNLKEDIPYVLHKRHVMNGTAASPLESKQHKHQKPKSPRSPKSPKIEFKNLAQAEAAKAGAQIEDVEDSAGQGFLFTQNVDLSKIDPVTLEIDKSTSPAVQLSSPKRDITKMMDPTALETLNNKLSQIESDSAPSSKTDSLQRLKQAAEAKAAELAYSMDVKNLKKEIIISSKRANKTRINPNKPKHAGKSKNKAKTRITSFSSDDESLDSDDVFGSAEAMPTKLEFSPPQSRKEIEPILKHEYSKITSGMWARGQTMSSTEIEGSPPQCRRLADLENRYHTSKLDAPHATATELRRISERSFSIPSSEEDNNTARKVDAKAAPAKASPTAEQAKFDKSEGEKKLQKPQGDAAPKKAESKLSASRTKLIEEMIDSSIIMRSKGHAPILFAHARLNLSEGSAFASLQRQKSTQDSPGAGRRAKSLDTPVISLHKLPPMNAFSSKDDTVDFEEEAEILETKPLHQGETIEEEKDESVQSCVGLITSYDANEVAASSANDANLAAISIEHDELELLDKLKYIEKITLQGVKIKEKRKVKTKLRSGNQLILEIPKYKFEPFSSGNSSIKTSPAVSRTSSIESSGKAKGKDSGYKCGTLKKKNTAMTKSEPRLKKSSDEKSPPSDSKIMKANKRASSQEDTLKRTKSQDLIVPRKEKSKSIEKIELRRFNSRDKKSVEESELDKAKRKERQQKLYESAMKQTISMMSPVKDTLPVFPAPEDKISVKTEGDKIIIDAHIQSKPEDHVFIAKSPKKLDSSLVKFSRSFDDTAKSMEKIDKANRSFEDRNKSFEDSEKSIDQAGEDMLLKSPRKLSKSQEIKQRIEGSVVHKKIEGKSKSLEKQVDSHQHLDVEYKTRSLDHNYESYIESTSPDSDSNCRQEVIRVEVHQSKYLSSDSDQHRERKSTDSDSRSLDEKPATKPTNLDLYGQKSEAKKSLANAERKASPVKQEESANETMDMQAIISERRSLDILKRQSLSSVDTKDYLTDNNDEDSITSVSELKKETPPMFRVPTIECEEASSEDRESDSSSIHKLNRNIALAKLNLERSKSDETTSWMTLECEEIVGNVCSDNERKPSPLGPLEEEPKYVLENQNTLDDTKDSIFVESEVETPPLSNVVITPPDSSPTIEKYDLPGTPVNAKKPKDSLEHSKTFRRRDCPKLSVERSRSSDTASSIEKDTSPVRGEGVREKGSLDDESSVSCSISRPLGISQDINASEHLKCIELRETMLKLNDTSAEASGGMGTTRVKIKSPTLEKQCPIDLGSGSELDQDMDQIESNISKILQRDDESHSSSSCGLGLPKELIPIPTQKVKSNSNTNNNNNSATNSNNNNSVNNSKNNSNNNHVNKPTIDVITITKPTIYLRTSDGDRSSLESKSSLDSKGSLSVESKGSFETESSSGSLGIAQRRGDLPQREQKTTWRPYPIESSGSSSVEDNWNPPDRNTYENFDLGSEVIDDFNKFEGQEKKESSSEEQKESDSDFQDELSDFPATFGYPEMTSTLGIGANPADIISYNSGFGMGRTLSRISERSTNSEKSSMEEEMSNIEEDISAHEESAISSEHQASVSSDIHSNSNPAYVSDADRRTSAEMPDIPCDSAAAERLSELYKANTTKTGRFQVLTVDENKALEKRLHDQIHKGALSNNGGSQDSEDWPLPEIPLDPVPPSDLDDVSTYRIPHSNKQIPKTFAWRKSIQSQDSENWPSPPSSVIETPVIEDVETFYLSEAQTPAQVMIDSYTDTTITLTKDDDEDSDPDYAEVPEIAPEPPAKDYERAAKAEHSSPAITSQPLLPYEETVYLMSDKTQGESNEPATCLASTLSTANCLRLTYDTCANNKSAQHNMLRDSNPDKVIIAQPTRSLHSPLCEDDFFLNDDVFCPGTVKIEISPDDSKQTDYVQQKFSRGSNNSDTSIDDMLSASCGTYMEDTVRRNLEPRRLSSGSCKKCSHSSHSEEETSSMGTDLDGTVKMGIQHKKCTHSSHSEDTSVGLSLSEWSTGTNTVRQYANLSGSDSLSAVSNISGGAKSEKSNPTTRSSLSSNNKSTESLNEKSGSYSSSKNRFSLDNGSDGPKYEIFSNSETDKFTSSETKSDENTLTLNEIVQSITDWSSTGTTTSSSSTLVAQNEDYQKDILRTSIEYIALKPPKPYKRLSSLDDKKNLPSVHAKPLKSRQNTPPDAHDEDQQKYPVKSTERPMKIPPKVVEVHTKSQHETTLNKRRSLELMSQRYHSQDISESENFNEKLYSQNEKFAERYQSQEFVPVPYNQKDQNAKIKSSTPPPAPPPTPSTITQQPASTMPTSCSIPNIQESVTLKHHSYDDKTLSKSQIREYKTSKMRHSQSFHEHLVSSELNCIDEEKIGSSTSTTTHTSENTTSTDNSSPMMPRPDKLVKCSPYYSSSLSSESPPIQVIQKPPRKGSIPKNVMPKSPPSGNDTDSSLDFRQQDPKFRTRGYRKRKQVPAKRSRMDRSLEQQESSECSEGYFPEIDSGSSDMSKEPKYPDFEEEPEMLPDDYDEDEHNYRIAGNNKSGESSSSAGNSNTGPATSYPNTSFSNKFEGLDMSENVDEMGFPRYDRLSHITNPMYKQAPQQHQQQQQHQPQLHHQSQQYQQLQQHHESTPSPPVKPIRQRKRQLKREESIVGKESPQYDVEYRGVQYTPESGSGTETKAGLSDDICYSSEDSFAAGYVGPSIRYQKNVEIPYPDFLSDYESEQMKASYIELEDDEEEELYKQQQQIRQQQYQERDGNSDSTEFDMSMVPPPYMFNNDGSGKMGDRY